MQPTIGQIVPVCLSMDGQLRKFHPDHLKVCNNHGNMRLYMRHHSFVVRVKTGVDMPMALENLFR